MFVMCPILNGLSLPPYFGARYRGVIWGRGMEGNREGERKGEVMEKGGGWKRERIRARVAGDVGHLSDKLL